MRGLIKRITDHGTVVEVTILEEKRLNEHEVYFDHHAFWNMVRAEARVTGREDHMTAADRLLDRYVAIEGELGQRTVRFDPEPEWADVEADDLG